ncbi:MAG: TonB-dependent receptor [Armatimonadota bacterium]
MKVRTFASIMLLMLLLAAVGPVIAGTTGIISGRATDSSTGEALSGVNIIITGTRLTTVTDENGYYVITNVQPGVHEVTASLIGYRDALVSGIDVMMDVRSTIDFALTQAVAEDEEVVVVEARPLMQAYVIPTMYIVDDKSEEMIKAQPNLLYQAPAIVGTQPGVVRDTDGTPHIRGGRADQIGWTIDGIPVFDPVSNGFGTNLVTVGMDKMEIFTGGYLAEYGNAISGVLNEVVKTGSTAPGFAVESMTGSDSFKGIRPEIGAENGKLDYYAAAYLWKSELEHPTFSNVDSADFIGKFNYYLDDKNSLTFLAAEGSEEYLLPTEHTETYEDGDLVAVPSTRDQQHQSHLLTALTWSHNLSSKTFFTLRPYYFRSRNRLDAIGMSDDSGWVTDSESATTGLKIDFTSQINPKHLVKVGGIQMSSNNRYVAIVPYMNDYVNYISPDVGEQLDLGEYEYKANADTVQTGLYIQDQIDMGERWAMDLGLRYDRMKFDKVLNDDTAQSQTSPRLGVSFAADPKTRFRFTYGRMIQFPRSQAVERDYTDPGWEDVIGYGNSDLQAERCTQYDFGWERRIGNDTTLSLTPFYRSFENLLQSRLIDPANPWGAVVFENLGEAKSGGVEVLLKKHRGKWSGWLAYTYQRARAQSSDDRETVDGSAMQFVDWDQRQTVALVTNYENRGWGYSLSVDHGSGLPWGDGNSERAPSHLVCDLNIVRDVKKGGLLPEGKINLSIANLFNVHTVLDRDYTYDPDTYEVTGSEPTAWVTPRFISLNFIRNY